MRQCESSLLWRVGGALGQAIVRLKRPVGLRNNNTTTTYNTTIKSNKKNIQTILCGKEKYLGGQLVQNDNVMLEMPMRLEKYCDDINFPTGKIFGEPTYKRLFLRGFAEKAVKHQ